MDRGKKPRTTAATGCMWSSLLSDPVREIGGRLLATGDIDYYLSMRAVVRSWRAAMVDPKEHPEDAHFLLPQWVMLDEEHYKDGHLFLNTEDGRFRHIELADLKDYYFVISTGCHLVLVARKAPHTVRVVNPLADSFIEFTAPIPDFLLHATAHLRLAGNAPTLVLEDTSGRRAYTARWKDKHFVEVKSYSLLDKAHNIWGIRDGKVGDLLSEKIKERSWEKYRSCHFMQSAGEMLFVLGRKDPAGGVEVFKVNFQQKVIEPLRNIGSRALFLGDRCVSVSVDADKLTSIDGNCMYYRGSGHHDGRDGIYKFDLTTEREEFITSDLMQFIGLYGKPVTSSMIQLLVNYCTNIPMSQLENERRYGQFQAVHMEE